MHRLEACQPSVRGSGEGVSYIRSEEEKLRADAEGTRSPCLGDVETKDELDAEITDVTERLRVASARADGGSPAMEHACFCAGLL